MIYKKVKQLGIVVSYISYVL